MNFSQTKYPQLFIKTTIIFCTMGLILPMTSKIMAACFTNAIGNYTQSAACTVAADTTEAIDHAQNNEASTTNTGILTVSSAITINSGVSGTTKLIVGSLSITSGTGSVSIGSSNASIVLGQGVWVTDSDGDGYAPNFTLSESTSSGKRRLGLMKSGSSSDCSDIAFSETNTCWSYGYGQAWYYGYGQAWYYGYGQATYMTGF